MEAWLPDGMSALVAGGLTAASFVTSLISASLGLGGGVLLLGLMAAVMPAAAIIPVHSVVQLFSNLGRAALMARHVDRVALPAFTVGSAVGALAGGALAVDLPAEAIRLGVGLFILWTLVAKPPAFFRRAAGLTGAGSSFLSMFVGATGPFVMAYVRTRELGRLGTVATHAGFMTLQHFLKMAAFGLFGFAFAPWAGLIAVMTVAGVLGTWAGGRVLMRLPERAFRIALNVLLTLIALRLVWEGASGLAH
jgi:uncharacterized membrane protein YfcA